MGFSREQINYGHPRGGGRKGGSAYARRADNPHTHQLPRGKEWSSPANDRKCVPHTIDELVVCSVGDCDHRMGHLCRDCDRVV